MAEMQCGENVFSYVAPVYQVGVCDAVNVCVLTGIFSLSAESSGQTGESSQGAEGKTKLFRV